MLQRLAFLAIYVIGVVLTAFNAIAGLSQVDVVLADQKYSQYGIDAAYILFSVVLAVAIVGVVGLYVWLGAGRLRYLGALLIGFELAMLFCFPWILGIALGSHDASILGMALAFASAPVILGILFALVLSLCLYALGLALPGYKRFLARLANVVPVAMIAVTAVRIITHVPVEEAGGPFYVSPTAMLRFDMIGYLTAAIVTAALMYRSAFPRGADAAP